MGYVCKNPPGERNPYQLIDYYIIAMYTTVFKSHFTYPPR